MTDTDLSLENRKDYALAVGVATGAVVGLCLAVLTPLYVYYTIGETLGAGNPAVFAAGLLMLTVLYLVNGGA